MSVWGFLHIVPVSDPDWVPNRSFLDKVIDYLEITRVDRVTGYAISGLQDGSAKLDENIVFERDFVSIVEALDLVETKKPKCVRISAYSVDGTYKLNQSIVDVIPDELSDSFRPWDTGLFIGASEISTPFEDGVVGTFGIDIILEGSGTPIDYEEYLKLVKQNPDLQAFLSFLRDESGKEWDVLYNGG
ncbi:MAG: hypothetical protein ACYC64_09245 [Armatimonadota bacterium]